MSDLRALAEAAKNSPEPLYADPGDIRMSGIPSFTAFGDGARFHAATNHEVVLALLDVVEAARAFVGGDYTWDYDTQGDPGPALGAALARWEEVSREPA